MTVEPSKRCTRCKKFKACTEFYPSKLGRMGRDSRCKLCRAEDYQARKHPKHTCALPPDAKQCRRCKHLLLLTRFSKKKKVRADGTTLEYRDTLCRDCASLTAYENRSLKPELYRETWRRYKQQPHRQAIEKSEAGRLKRNEAAKRYRERQKVIRQLRKEDAIDRQGGELRIAEIRRARTAARKREYRKRNADRIREVNRAWRERNAEDILVKKREWFRQRAAAARGGAGEHQHAGA